MGVRGGYGAFFGTTAYSVRLFLHGTGPAGIDGGRLEMDDEERLHALMELLEFGNMPKVVKKKALFEICKSVGLGFSAVELEAIETTFARMERKPIESVGELRCPFCLRLVTDLRALDASKRGNSHKDFYIKHLDECLVLTMILNQKLAHLAKQTKKK